MKHYETTTETKTVTTRTCVSRSCDLCGAKAESNYGLDETNWANGFGVDETVVKATIEVSSNEGTNCPDGGSGRKTIVDLCPKCFKNRLLPWLRSQGAQIETEEWDW